LTPMHGDSTQVEFASGTWTKLYVVVPFGPSFRF
jgi:hypothetical protein